MDARIAPQTQSGLGRVAPGSFGAPAPAPARTATEAAGTHAIAMLLFDLSRVPRPGSKISPEVAEMVMNRCVLAAIEVLSAAEAQVTMAGTEARPSVEAVFSGERSALRAAKAACDVLGGVRRVQRAAENEFQVVGAITAGSAGPGPGGVTVTTGGPDVLLRRLREAAAPGQILMSAAAVAGCEGLVETSPARTSSEAVPEAHVLRRMRPALSVF
ncbi:MAG TPA: hypothetical protein VGB19_15085 [Actinomycetota bacterium]